ncbi:MAG: lipocalin family protein [Oligoflexales bacterium]
MKIFTILFYIFIAGIAFGKSNKPLETVKNLDIEQYMGNWYEVASIPQRFQSQCVANTKAEYELLDNGKVVVVNKCEKKDGSLSTAYARARVNKKYKDQSKLQVTFVSIWRWWIWLFSGDYWVMKIGNDYEYAVVGHPNRKYLWILSREPIMDGKQLTELERYISSQEYDSCKVKITQEGDFKKKALCALKEAQVLN